jgi:uncharacterized membrane protein YbaN (DUF454 family)
MYPAFIELIAAGGVGTLIYAMEYNIMKKGFQRAEDNWESNTGLSSHETQSSIDRKSQMIALSVAIISASYSYYYIPAIIMVGGIVVISVVYTTFVGVYQST